uniref:PP2A regulatory subunit B'' EF-hand domain-containing protein n=1 Tax=Phlebotomus papatasi TaxID=29031 RepID=A0A1B0DC33_PHLPP
AASQFQLTPFAAVVPHKNTPIRTWTEYHLSCHDAPSRFVYILSKGNRSRPYILPEDLAPLVQDVVETHPGLAFLKEAAEFHSRYVHTVIARIFYSVNRSWSGRITVSELRRSNLLQVIQLLEEEEDINQIMAYFSYEHFYVIYCKFWELDRDHDLLIDQNDLARHNDHALSLRMIERIFSGCVTRGGMKNRNMGPNGPRITYTDFVWFLLSEEDKSNPTAIEYWFRCMDLDGEVHSGISVETTTQRIQSTVHQFPNSQIHRDEFHQIVATCGFPVYWRAPLFNCTQHTPSGCVDGYKFVDFWKQ